MKKTIKINQTIYELVSEYPEIKEIMVSLGFTDIIKPIMLNTAGRIMTLKAGAKIKKIDWDLINRVFLENNFILEDQ